MTRYIDLDQLYRDGNLRLIDNRSLTRERCFIQVFTLFFTSD
jgi:hypothetical protein